MMINRSNYEAFFLDEIEGRLSPDHRELLRRFLQDNPDLAQELEMMGRSMEVLTVPIPPESPRVNFRDSLYQQDFLGEEVRLVPGNETFDGREGLKVPRSVDKSDWNMKLVAYAEGDLTGDEKTAVESRIESDPSVRRDFQLLSHSRLPKERILYPWKAELKRKNGRLTAMRYFSFSAAAAIAVLVMVSLFNSDERSAFEAGLFATKLNALQLKADGSQAIQSDGKVLVSDDMSYQLVQASSDEQSHHPSDEYMAMETEDVQRIQPRTFNPDDFNVSSAHNGLAVASVMEIPENESANTPASVEKEYPSIWEFAERQAKRKIWGDGDYPRENFVSAYAQRTLGYEWGTMPAAIHVEQVNDGGKREFSLQFGRFSYSRVKH